MEFSVLMSVYYKEEPEYLKQALKSVINQTRPPSEIIIVKDGELTPDLDRVLEVFKMKYSGLLRLITLPQNQGLGHALKVGLEFCQFGLVARMDTDDVAMVTRFEKQLDILKRFPDIDMVGSFITEFDGETNNILSERKVPISTEEINRGAKRRNPFNHVSVMFRKQAVLDAGNYQPFLWQEDYFLWARMIKKGSKMINIPESLVYVRTGRDMFERRGGILYIKSEIRLQMKFLRMGFIGMQDFIFNVIARTIIRLLPNKMRAHFYVHFLRK